MDVPSPGIASQKTAEQEPARRAAYEKKFQARLDQWRAKVDALRARARETEADAEISSREAVDQAQDSLEDYRRQVEGLRSSGDAALKDLVEGCADSWQTFKQSFDRAASRFL